MPFPNFQSHTIHIIVSRVLPLGALLSGGSQHGMWKPRSHASQNNMSS